MKNLLLVILFASPFAWAQPREEGPRRDNIVGRLRLTDAQERQFDRLRSDVQRKQIAVRSRIQTLRLDIRDAFREEKPDRGKIESKMGEIGKLQNETKLNRLGLWFDVNSILTPEQQAVWKEQRRMMPRMGRHGSDRRRAPMDRF